MALERPQQSDPSSAGGEASPASVSDPVEVFYETRYHARGGPPSSSSLSAQPEQIGRGAKGGLLSYLSVKGIQQLKAKLNGYKQLKTSKRSMSLFISPSGERLAVASGNQITILQHEDNYMTPCGVFTSDISSTIFTYGSWLEPQGILGVIDNVDTFHIIKSNGEEISRITSRELRLSVPSVGLIALGDLNAEHTFLESFCIVTVDGSFHCLDINQKPSASICPSFNSSSQLRHGDHFPRNVACLDFSPDLSLVALVCDVVDSTGYSVNCSGFYSLYLWRVTRNLESEMLFHSPSYQGLFSAPKGHSGRFINPRVLISPQGMYVAALDMNGCLDVYLLGHQPFSLSTISLDRQNSETEQGGRKCLKDIVDFSWWSNHVLILAMRNNAVAMLDVHSGLKFLRKDPIFYRPVLERVTGCQGYVFALECTSSTEGSSPLVHGETMETLVMPPVAHRNCEHLNVSPFCWSLVSLSARSMTEMYEILIQKHQYQEALDFANRYRLDSDEVFKAQWLSSDHGVDDINAYLSNIKDQNFVLSECVDRIGSTEDAVMTLLSYGLHITDQYKFSVIEDDKSSSIWKYRIVRLRLLQYRDKLETFLGINMGRFSMKEYSKFRALPVSKSAIALAESGKIGALNLLFKRHPYSLAGDTLRILSAIPETVAVQSYGQLLPGRSPPTTANIRDADWVECETMASFIDGMRNSCKSGVEIKTETILKHMLGLVWPSTAELSDWYRNRARDIDNLSGQLDNCLSLLDFACRKGIVELQEFLDDVTYLHQLIYSGDGDTIFFMSLVSWEQLSDFEKFKMMLKGVTENNVVGKLMEKAIPFMVKRHNSRNRDWKTSEGSCQQLVDSGNVESFLVTWLKEIAAGNQMDMCLAVVEEGCKGLHTNGIFKDESEAVETALDCLYLCTLTDCWGTMASIISKLPRRSQKEKITMVTNDSSSRHTFRGFGSPRSVWINQASNTEIHVDATGIGLPNSLENSIDENNSPSEDLEKRIKAAEGHVEVGRLLAFYQVPKPMSFFQGAHLNEKNVKQLVRLVLSKFSRQPGRADSDWAKMWRDIQCFQEKAFPFLDKEYMLIEFCRGLLKAGKFSLARNYLKGTSNIALAAEKAEGLVIQAAREYFFSASSLACSEIWKAKECLSLFPNSDNLKAEFDIIDALTTKLPNLGVTILPVQFRQIRNPMEIINMVITSQTGAYLDVDDLIEIAKMLGLKSHDDIAAIQEAVAREAAVGGDMQLAFDLCLVLSKKGHGPIWDLASAIARGPILDNMDTISRKQLLGFALSHCDDESIGELLHAWKDIDMEVNSEKLMMLTRTSPPNFVIQDSSIISLPVKIVQDSHGFNVSVEGTICEGGDSNCHIDISNIKSMLSTVVKGLPNENGGIWEYILTDSGKVSFIALQLPWLLALSMEDEQTKESFPSKTSTGKCCMPVRMQAGLCALSWLAMNNLTSDNLIASLAKFLMEIPASRDEDVMGCLFLLNLVDSFLGVKVFEEQLTIRHCHPEVYTIMSLGMMYSSLQSSVIECSSPSQRRILLQQRFQEMHASCGTDDMLKIDEVESTFWREWKVKLEEQKKLADQVRELENIIPGLETARFLSGDIKYVEDAILTFVDSVRLEKKHILREAVKLADTYGLARVKVILRYLGCALVSEHWTDDEILAEISDFKDDVVASASEVIAMISSVVYPEIEGLNKSRLSYIYSILSACHLHLKRTRETTPVAQQEPAHAHRLELFQFYKILDQECRRVSFIKELNFKRIAGLHDLNFENFDEEVYKHISVATVEALANMVQVLVGIYDDPQDKGLISRLSVYKHHILSMLADIEFGYKSNLHPESSDSFLSFIGEVEKNYESCKASITTLSGDDILFVIGKYFTLCMPSSPLVEPAAESLGKQCLLEVLNFWIKVANDMTECLQGKVTEGVTDMLAINSLSECLQVFRKLVLDDEVSANQGWSAISIFIKLAVGNSLHVDTSLVCKAMIFSGCKFKGIVEVLSKASFTNSTDIQDVVNFYVNAIDSSFNDLVSDSGDRRVVHKLLSSVSKLDYYNLEDLNTARSRIWERLTAFSENMQLPNNFRVYALELMQTVAGRSIQSFPDELLYAVEQWEGWVYPSSENSTLENLDPPNKLTSSIVALKSTDLIAAISPNLEITSEDLSTVDSATSCFLSLSEVVVSKQHIDSLRAILLEWEELFTNQMNDRKSSDLVEESNNWSGDEWGDGWENLPDEPTGKEAKKDECASIHPLHTCWMETIKKLIKFSQLGTVTELMDHSLSRSQFILLSEDEAHELEQLLSDIDYIICLKILLLLPYEDLWFQSLSKLEDALNRGDLQNKTGEEFELLMLILSSGLLPSIATDPAYSKVFCYLCHLVGLLSRRSQEDLLKHRRDINNKNTSSSLLFCNLLLPCFISELVIAGQYLLAGHIVSQWMHTHASFRLINVLEISLRKFLEGSLQKTNESGADEMVTCGSLMHTCLILRKKLENLLQTSLSAL